MLPKERVYAALEHREPDRIPWGEHSIDHNVYEDILGRETLVQAKIRTTRALWEGRRDEYVEHVKRDGLELARALEFDIITAQTVPSRDQHPAPMKPVDDETYQADNGDIYRISSATGDLRLFQKVAPVTCEPPTLEGLQEKIDHVDEKPLPDPQDSNFEAVHHAVREMGETHFITMNVGGLSWPWFGPTEEDQYMSLVLEPDICRKVAELEGRRMIRMLDVYAKLGLDGITPCEDLGTSVNLMASPEIYREMIYPWHKARRARAHELGLKVLKHCCGHVWPIIQEIAETSDAYEGIQATGGMDIGKLKAAVGNRLCLWGGIWHEHIIDSDVNQIREDARYAFSTAAPGGGYIMGSSHSLAVGAKAENILEMKRLKNTWGTYPINPKNFKD